jgi:hypothetical protein
MRLFHAGLALMFSTLASPLLGATNARAGAPDVSMQARDVARVDALPLESDCSLKCDKEAATCVDGCETTYPDDAAKRVQCKVDCIDKRQTCDAKCK